jgi:hypothetical protein
LSASAFSGSNVRGAASVDGTNFWIGGTSSAATNGGVWYAPLGASGGGTQITDTPNNMRMVAVYGGQLYGDSGSGTFTAVLTFGGLPTTSGATATLLPGMSTGSPVGFVLLDADASVAGLDTLYVADTASGLERWTFNGTTWAQDTTFTVLTGGCLGATGWVTGSGVTVIATMSNGTIERVVVPTAGAPSATLLVTAAANTAYRGVALAPH